MLRTRSFLPPFSRALRRSQRGFTLAELLVAVIAGLLVAIAAFSFSKQSSRFFAREARIASAQVSVLSGFQRLQADIARASFLGTPNMRRDRDLGRVCAPDWDVPSNWPADMQNLTGVRVNVGGSSSYNGVAAGPDGLFPDSIRLTGSFSSSELFPVRTIQAGTGGGSDVYFQVNTGPFSRAGIFDDTSMLAVFRPGRILRVVDQHGDYEYGIIQSASFGGGQPVVSTAAPLPLKGDITSGLPTTAPCGIDGLAVGVQANVLETVEYGIANLSGAIGSPYLGTLYEEGGTAPGDEYRTELVRHEVDLLGASPSLDQDPTSEVVAEYAVDLRFAAWVNAAGLQGLQYLAPGSTDLSDRMLVDPSGYDGGSAPPGPETIRSLEIRLMVRSREVEGIAEGGLPEGGVFQYLLPSGQYTRARTLIADVTLPNQRGDSW